MNQEFENRIIEKNFFQKNWIFIAVCILLIIGGVITFILLKSPNQSKGNNNNNTSNNPLSTTELHKLVYLNLALIVKILNMIKPLQLSLIPAF
jgi:flagellar basal body-associated protein FliL